MMGKLIEFNYNFILETTLTSVFEKVFNDPSIDLSEWGLEDISTDMEPKYTLDVDRFKGQLMKYLDAVSEAEHKVATDRIDVLENKVQKYEDESQGSAEYKTQTELKLNKLKHDLSEKEDIIKNKEQEVKRLDNIIKTKKKNIDAEMKRQLEQLSKDLNDERQKYRRSARDIEQYKRDLKLVVGERKDLEDLFLGAYDKLTTLKDRAEKEGAEKEGDTND